MISIRNFKKEDFNTLDEWCNKRDMQGGIVLELLPEETTFVLEFDNKPVMALGLYLTNCKGISYLNNFISDPDFGPKDIRHECSSYLMNFVFDFANELGYKNVLCFAVEEGIKKRYQEIGMNKTFDNLSSFVRNL